MIYIDEPGIVKWKAVQGSTFYRAMLLRWKATQLPVDLTGFSAKLGGKRNINQSALDIDLSTTGGTITLGGVAGTVVINAPLATVRTWPVGNISIQFEFSQGGATQTYFVGIITVAKEIPV